MTRFITAVRRYGVGLVIVGLVGTACSSSASTAVSTSSGATTPTTSAASASSSAQPSITPRSTAVPSTTASSVASSVMSPATGPTTGASAAITTDASVTTSSSTTGTSSSSGATRPSTAVLPPGRAAEVGLKPVTVPVKLVRTKSSVQVLVPVTMHSKQYYFIVDTGATVTFLDSTVAKSLQLAAIGTAGSGTSIGCTSPIQPVALANWSIGGQALPGSVIPSEKTDFAGKKYQGVPIAGLLGADLYYLYGTATLDYRKATLSLGRAAPTGTQSFPFTPDVSGGGVRVLAQLTLHGTQGGFVVDTGASVTELDSAFATKAGLTKVGAATRVSAVSCSTSVQPVRFDNASVGSVKLPTVTAISSKNAMTQQSNGMEQGLLGSDILSTFGEVTFDFLHRRIVLG